jgi:uncharacterized protein YbjT (DUF2867 family)
MNSKPVLVLGATGYVGGRLVPKLLESGIRVRALARSASKIKCRPWGLHPLLEVAEGDVLDLDSLKKATTGCWAAVYLVHSMRSAKATFVEADRKSAENLVTAAAESGMDRIIYLGGLGSNEDVNLSEHLKSRQEVGRILNSGPVPATILRAAMILGSGSASFEMLRYLTDRLPIMVTPGWVRTPVQPIAITNVLDYLQECLDHAETAGQTYDIGGPDILSYEKLIEIYAEEAKLSRRRVIPIPFLTPRLSALWIHLLTPIPSSIAQPLAEGLINKVVCQDNRIRSIIPLHLLGCRETIRRAIEKIEQQRVETCWSDAGALLPPEWTYCGDAEYAGGTILECGYHIDIAADPEEVWKPIARIGGKTGWYFGNPLWWLRGFVDRLMGGIGIRRGRREGHGLYTGDALDCWRVLEVAPPHRLLLLAEMMLPGEALLEFSITPLGVGKTRLRQLSRFVPKGLAGLAYWYALYPFHEWIFGGMLRSIAKTVGKPVIRHPERFTPRLKHACRMDRQQK